MYLAAVSGQTYDLPQFLGASSKGIEVVEGITVPQAERVGVFEGFEVTHLVLDGFNGPHLCKFLRWLGCFPHVMIITKFMRSFSLKNKNNNLLVQRYV